MTAEQAAVREAIAGGRRAGGPFRLQNDDGSLRGPFNAMLLSPAVGLALQGLGAAVRYDSSLGGRVREMAILIVAAHWNSAFEHEAHEAVGRVAGVSDAELAALRRGELPLLEDDAERLALRTTLALVRNATLDEQEYADAVNTLGERALFELTVLVGYYSTLALQLRVFAGEEAPKDAR